MDPYSESLDADSKSDDNSETESLSNLTGITSFIKREGVQAKNNLLAVNEKVIANRHKVAAEDKINAASSFSAVSSARMDTEEEPEVKDEFKKFIFFLHFPFVYVFSILAFVGTCLEICIAYPGQALTQEIKANLASSQNELVKNVNDYLSLMFAYFAAIGMELREYSLQTVSFWVNFSSLANPRTNDPLALALDINSVFSPFSKWVIDTTNFN